MRVEEQDRVIGDLEASLQRQGFDADRRLTQQQQQYEKKIQVGLGTDMRAKLCPCS